MDTTLILQPFQALELRAAGGFVDATFQNQFVRLGLNDGAVVAHHYYTRADGPLWEREVLKFGSAIASSDADMETVRIPNQVLPRAELYACRGDTIGRVVTNSRDVLEVGPQKVSRDRTLKDLDPIGYYVDENNQLRPVWQNGRTVHAENRCWDLPNDDWGPVTSVATTRFGLAVHQRGSLRGPVRFLSFGEERDVAACRRVSFRVVPPVADAAP